MGIFLQNKVVQSENQSLRLQYEASEKRRGYKKERLQTVQNQILMDRPRREFVEKNIDTIDFFADSDEEEGDEMEDTSSDGFHDKQMQYALQNSPRPEASVRSEVRRYFNNPGQATAYKIGMLKILEYRSRAEEALGDSFDIRAFHDTVLGSGPLPMALLESKVERWIDASR